MSDADRPPREWRFCITDMIEFAEKVLAYTKGMNQDTLVADPLRYDAVLRNLELIGEAATHIPDHVRVAHPDVPWRAIVGLRNRLAHGYLTVLVGYTLRGILFNTFDIRRILKLAFTGTYGQIQAQATLRTTRFMLSKLTPRL